jgi:hypothetical protein
MVRFRDMKLGDDARVRSFCRAVWSDTVRRTARVILDTAFGKSFGDHELVDVVCAGRGQVGLAKVAMSPSVPVVAVGGPVRIYYGEVAERLGCEMVFPPFFDVANAVGAATGVIAQSVIVTVEGDGSGLFRLHAPGGTRSFTNAAEAVATAEELARSAAITAVAQLGGADPQAQVTVKKHLLPDAVDDSGLLEAVVRAEAIGRPDTASSPSLSTS